MLAIRCCDGNGNGWSPRHQSGYPSAEGDCGDSDYEYKDGATFEEAESVCSENGYQLCTLQQAYYDLDARGTGCRYDAVYHWVSDSCDDPLDSGDAAPSPALVNERAETGSMTAEDIGSNGNAAGNGSNNLSTTVTIIAAAVGVVFIVAVAAALFSKRRKASVHFEADSIDHAVNGSPSDIAVNIENDKVTADSVAQGDDEKATAERPTMNKSAVETEGNDAVEVAQ